MKTKIWTVVNREHKLLIPMLSMIGTGVILFSTRQYGVGLSPDSVGYIATARHIASGMGAISYDGKPLLVQPPLYPLVLALMGNLLRVDPLVAAPVLNAILFGSIVYLSGLLCLKYVKSSASVAVLATVSVLVSIPLIEVSLMAWSEPLFICFVLLSFIAADEYRTKGDMLSLLLVSISVALACLTRYVGILLIPVGIINILLSYQASPRTKFWYWLFFVFISVVPIGGWLIRNHILSGTLFGPRASSIYTLSQNLSFALRTLLSWYIPRIVAERCSLLILCGITLIVLGCLADSRVRQHWPTVKTSFPQMGLPVLFSIVYVGFLIISSTTTAYDRIDNRLLSPVFVPITLVLLSVLFEILPSLTGKQLLQRSTRFLRLITLVAWLAYSGAAAIVLISRAQNQGQGYNSLPWRSSQTINYLLKETNLQSNCTIYSNAPDALYILGNITAKLSPKKTMYNSPEVVEDLSSLRGSWPEENQACLVWFHEDIRSYLFTVDELRTIANVQPIAHLEDGSIYLITRTK